MNASAEESTRQPETQLIIATEDKESPNEDPDDPDEFLPELPFEEDPEETPLEEEPAAPTDDQASFDAVGALSGLPHDLFARRPDRFLLRLVVQEIATLGVLVLAVLALAHFKVWRFPLLADEIGSILGLTTPTARPETRVGVKQRMPKKTVGGTRAVVSMPADRAPERVSTSDRLVRDLGAPPTVVPDAFGMYAEGDSLVEIGKRECRTLSLTGDIRELLKMIETIRLPTMILPRVRRDHPRFLLLSQIFQPERLELYDVASFDRQARNFQSWKVRSAPIRDHAHLYRIEAPVELSPGLYALGFMEGFIDAGHHTFWPFRVE